MEGQKEGQQHCAKPLRESFKSYYLLVSVPCLRLKEIRNEAEVKIFSILLFLVKLLAYCIS